jgi:hypothetical protein
MVLVDGIHHLWYHAILLHFLHICGRRVLGNESCMQKASALGVLYNDYCLALKARCSGVVVVHSVYASRQLEQRLRHSSFICLRIKLVERERERGTIVEVICLHFVIGLAQTVAFDKYHT